MSDLLEAVLRCHRCGADARHEIRYAGRLIVGTRCAACGHELDAGDLRRYLADLRHRAATKPARMLRRLRENPAEFILTAPGAAVSKPLKVLHEVATVVRAGG